jgi:YrbI family 3-deoxy-D-manno-octulosonate 8-phosphate phosphatase
MATPEQINRIRLLVTDVDGVLTDGAVIYGTGQVELKAFNIKDGLGIRLATWGGLPVLWLTGRSSEVLTRRAAELGAEVVQGASDKDARLRAVARDHGVALDEIAYVADDLNDLPALRLVGLPIAVADAVPEVHALAAYTTAASGGRGAVREVIELILRGQGRWDAAMETYLTRIRGAHAGQ